MIVPFRERGNNLVPVVLNPSFSSVPCTTFPFLDPIDPGTWLLIPCTRSPEEHLCHACQLGRHVRLPFSSSSSHATHSFDLVHCDLWTSPITSMSGYKYYLVVLDDFLIMCGPFRCVPSLRLSPPSATSSPGCPLSSASPLRTFSVTTVVSSITSPLVTSFSPTGCSCGCLARIPPPRMARLSA
jgi:hypothetical protein